MIKAARMFRNSDKELSKRSFAQMGEVGIALRNFIENNDSGHYYWNEIQQGVGICVEKVEEDVVRVRFDSGRTKYYRIYLSSKLFSVSRKYLGVVDVRCAISEARRYQREISKAT